MFIYKVSNTEDGRFYFGYSELDTRYYSEFGQLDPHNQFEKLFGSNGLRRMPVVRKSLIFKSGNEESILNKLKSLKTEFEGDAKFIDCFGLESTPKVPSEKVDALNEVIKIASDKTKKK